MQTDRSIDRLRRLMRPGVGLHVSMTLLLGAFAGAGMVQGMTTFAALCGLAAVLVWIWYIRRRQSAREMVDGAIAAVGEEALAADFAQAQPVEDELLLGHLMAYQKGGFVLPLSALRQLYIEDTHRPKSAGSNRSEPATRLFCVDETGKRRHLATLRHHSASFEPIVTQILTDVPLCALLYDVTDDVAEFAQALCAALCRDHPEAGFIRQHDVHRRLWGVSRTLQEGFVAFSGAQED